MILIQQTNLHIPVPKALDLQQRNGKISQSKVVNLFILCYSIYAVAQGSGYMSFFANNSYILIFFYCIAKIKRGKPPKRRSNKHNSRRSAAEKDNTDFEEDSDSDESLLENEEFQVVMDSESILRPGYFSAKICIRILYLGRCLRQWLFLQF